MLETLGCPLPDQDGRRDLVMLMARAQCLWRDEEPRLLQRESPALEIFAQAAHHFDNRAKDKQVLHLVNRLQNLGYNVQIAPQAA
jgi:hypothetical protein